MTNKQTQTEQEILETLMDEVNNGIDYTLEN